MIDRDPELTLEVSHLREAFDRGFPSWWWRNPRFEVTWSCLLAEERSSDNIASSVKRGTFVSKSNYGIYHTADITEVEGEIVENSVLITEGQLMGIFETVFPTLPQFYKEQFFRSNPV